MSALLVPRRVLLEVGRVPGWRGENKFGHLPSAAQGGARVVAPEATVNWLAAEQTISVVSASTADGAAGDNARTIVIVGLDGDGAEVTETLPLDGTTPVSTANAYMRLNRAYVDTVGVKGNTNAGAITLSYSGTTHLSIPLGFGQSQTTVYTSPRTLVTGETVLAAVVVDFTFTSESSKSATFAGLGRPDFDSDGTTVPHKGIRRLVTASGVSSFTKDDEARLLPPGADMWVEATPGSTGDVSGFYNIWLQIDE